MGIPKNRSLSRAALWDAAPVANNGAEPVGFRSMLLCRGLTVRSEDGRNTAMLLARVILVHWLFLVLIVGCSEDRQLQPNPQGGSVETPKATSVPHSETAEPATASKNQAVAPQPPGRPLPDPLRGKVKETMNSGGYTYVLLATEHGDLWAAAKEFAVVSGDEVEVGALMPMRNFHSATLERTFQQVLFVARASVIGSSPDAGPARPEQGPPKTGVPPGHPPIGDTATLSKPAPSAPKKGQIEVLSNGLTVTELFDKRADLNGKAVKFRGRVVKANRGILGRNWLHIQDGTGEPGSNDITVTSVTGFATPGTLVVIEGTLGLEKDFGAGYTYDVIVEDAIITAQPTE